ncbi:MAG: hypothetical protein C5B59_14380 [Bacteroidetes bacterium]|nr:MAG: hypothetical protein C5B59_14380 [Bacteroidota bacterium]
MSRYTISKANKALLKKASRKPVEDYFVSVPNGRRSTRWIRINNYYRLSASQEFETDAKANPPTFRSDQIVEYIGASVPTHVIDGWSFLGRAVEATLRGDNYSAIHFAYYSELRAAMGLLAAEGMGVFSKRHAVLDSASTCDALPKKIKPKKTPQVGTHTIVWPLLDYWSSLRRAFDLLDEIVSPESIRMSKWLLGTGATVPARAIAQYWFRTWGVDLAAVDEDHDKRNLASYRPSQFRRPPRLDSHEVISFVEELWTLFEPQQSRRFPVLESALLRSARRKVTASVAAIPDLEKIGLSNAEATEWSSFFAKSDPIPLIAATRQSVIEDPRCHLQILSRAALLLFVATSAARRLLVNAAYTQDLLGFWWRNHGEDRCLWGIGGVPADPLDLWADILEAITDSSSWRLANPVGTVSLRDWRRTNAAGLDYLGGLELIGIWGLLP